MAKSGRASTVKRNQALKQKKQLPLLAENDRKRNLRMSAYMALQRVRAAEKLAKTENKEAPVFDDATKAAAEHGAELEHCDQQKRDLRDAGHFFFVHPSIKKSEDIFPVVSNPDGVVAPYTGEMDESDKNIRMPKLERVALALARKKKYRHKKRHAHVKF